jgi:hypothetical protein
LPKASGELSGWLDETRLFLRESSFQQLDLAATDSDQVIMLPRRSEWYQSLRAWRQILADTRAGAEAAGYGVEDSGCF